MIITNGKIKKSPANFKPDLVTNFFLLINMKVEISNFSVYKTLKLWKTLPVLLIFFTSCKTNRHIHHNVNTYSGSKVRTQIVRKAKSLIGTKYKYGGSNPREGFDCSGLTYYIYKLHNINLPRTSKSQSHKGKKISIKNAKAGDLIFFKNKNKINHVGIIINNSKGHLYVIHSTSSSGVKKDDVINNKYWKKRITFVRDIITQ